MDKYIVFGHLQYFDNDALEKHINDIGEFVCFADHNKEKQRSFDKVMDPEIIGAHPDAIIVINSYKTDKICKFIRGRGWKNRIVHYPHLHNPQYHEDMDRKAWVEEYGGLLFDIYEDDEYTRNLLKELLYERGMTEFKFVEPERLAGFPRTYLYFYDDALAPKNDFTLVDGGAYDGDSIRLIHEKFGERMKRVYAYEPDFDNFSLLLGNISKMGLLNKVVPYNYGIYDQNVDINFTIDAQASHIDGAGEKIIHARTMDSTLGEVIGDVCVKMDVEGSEIAALEGARRTIGKYLPYMAIYVYHKFNDIWEVPAKIRSINDGYKFFLRCGTHLECYAVPARHWDK